MSRAPYTVVGGGAIGGTLAVHMANHGVDVQIVDTDAEHVHAINERGLTIHSADSELTAEVPAFLPEDGPDQVGGVLLAVKSHFTEIALDWVQPRLAEDGFVVSMQNGLNEPVIAARIGEQRTVAAFVDLFADLLEPGVIKDGGTGMIAMGEYAGGGSARIDQLAADLTRWGHPVISDNVIGYLWSKLAFSTILGGTALQDEDMSVLVDRHRDLWTSLVREVIAVADAMGMRLENFDGFEPSAYRPAVPEEQRHASLDRLVAFLAGQTKTRSGVWRDIAVRRRRTEVPARFEQVIGIAAKHDIATPGLRGLVDLVSALETGRTEMGSHLIQQLREAVRSPAMSQSKEKHV